MLKKRRRKKRLLIAGLCVCFILISIPRIRSYITYSRQLKYYEQEIINLQEENKHLQEKIEAMKKDPYYAEKALRENYGYVKEGEYIYRIKKEKKE
ncbi:MAG: septum formation initiator family protein [Candidatus Ratteibacteria bacterium]|nr:septum formation initiator family protein [Candidatus Ratteibacteria bacterium]